MSRRMPSKCAPLIGPITLSMSLQRVMKRGDFRSRGASGSTAPLGRRSRDDQDTGSCGAQDEEPPGPAPEVLDESLLETGLIPDEVALVAGVVRRVKDQGRSQVISATASSSLSVSAGDWSGGDHDRLTGQLLCRPSLAARLAPPSSDSNPG